MKGRQRDRPTKWVQASVQEEISAGKPGVAFEIWGKWKKKRRKLVVGLCWPHKAPSYRQRTWDDLARWFEMK